MLSPIPSGDYELNVGHPHGTPTLVPSVGLEQRLDVRLSPRPETGGPPLRLAVHLHVFYLDALDPLLQRLLDCQQGLGRFDLWISTDSSAKAEQLSAAIQNSPLNSNINALQVRVCTNRGRNLGPLLQDLWPELRGYDLLLHLHGKRSVETDLGSSWLEQLLATLLPTAAEVAALRERLACDPSLGLVMPQPPALIRPYLNWGDNFELASQLARRLNGSSLSRQALLLFPAGMMFWCRPQALAPLVAVAADLEEMPPEPLAVDGTSLHALERLVAHSCETAGLNWRLLCEARPAPDKLTPAALSVWQPRPEAYLQATALLAARARSEYEQRLCDETNLAKCTKQLQELTASAESQLRSADSQISSLMAAVKDRDQRLQDLQRSLSWRLTRPLRLLVRLTRRLRPERSG
jgi:lipopolysaccharide biosynthesis protein